MYPGAWLNAIPNKNTLTAPIEKNILYTLKASTLPGKIFDINPPVFVCKKFQDAPHKNEHTNAKGRDLAQQQTNEVNAAASTMRVPTVANLNLQNFSPILFITNPVKA